MTQDQELDLVVRLYIAADHINATDERVSAAWEALDKIVETQKKRKKERTKERKNNIYNNNIYNISTETDVISKQSDEFVYSKLVSWPQGFDLTKEMSDYAVSQGRSNPRKHFIAFRNWALAKGAKYKDWKRAWMNWCQPKAWEPGYQKPVALPNREITEYKRRSRS